MRGVHREAREHLVLQARIAFDRLLVPVLDATNPERILAERALRALPAMILQRQSRPVLAGLADPTVSLASLETQLPGLEAATAAEPQPQVREIVRAQPTIAQESEPLARIPRRR